MKRHHNFDNEITGEYYESTLLEKVTEGLLVAFVLVAGIMMIADYVFGAETVTNFIADLLGSLMG